MKPARIRPVQAQPCSAGSVQPDHVVACSQQGQAGAYFRAELALLRLVLGAVWGLLPSLLRAGLRSARGVPGCEMARLDALDITHALLTSSMRSKSQTMQQL